MACFSPDSPLPEVHISPHENQGRATSNVTVTLTAPEQQLKDDGQYVRRNHRQFEILHRLQQPNGLDLERPVGRVAPHVVDVVEAVSRQKSFSVQDQDGVGEEQPRLEER